MQYRHISVHKTDSMKLHVRLLYITFITSERKIGHKIIFFTLLPQCTKGILNLTQTFLYINVNVNYQIKNFIGT